MCKFHDPSVIGSRDTEGGSEEPRSCLCRGVNFGFWSHLRCSGQNGIIFSRAGLV